MDAFVNNFQEGMNFMWKIGKKNISFTSLVVEFWNSLSKVI